MAVEFLPGSCSSHQHGMPILNLTWSTANQAREMAWIDDSVVCVHQHLVASSRVPVRAICNLSHSGGKSTYHGISFIGLAA